MVVASSRDAGPFGAGLMVKWVERSVAVAVAVTPGIVAVALSVEVGWGASSQVVRFGRVWPGGLSWGVGVGMVSWSAAWSMRSGRIAAGSGSATGPAAGMVM